jgi:hypothetical protein
MEANIKDYESLVKVKNVLGWDDYELSSTIEVKTLPLFENVAQQLFNKVIDNTELGEELSFVLEERLNSLKVSERKARSYLISLFSKKNAEYMNQIDKVYSVSNSEVEPTFKIMVSYSHTLEALKKLTSRVLRDSSIPIPGLPFADMVKYSMYKMQITRKKGGLVVSNEMFDLTPDEKQSVKKVLALPKVTSWINQCISENNLDENAKNAYNKILDEFGVKSEEWLPTAVDFYYQEVEKIAKSKAIPSASDMERLKTLKTFLNCTEVYSRNVNLELFGDKYVKALTESMTPTGVITDDYLNGLERLRIRLDLDENDAKNLLGFATRKRITPIIKDLIDVYKSDTDANVRNENDLKKKNLKSSDPISSIDNVLGFMETGAQKSGGGPNVFMREALNLVDFYVENYGIQGFNLTSEVIEKKMVNVVGSFNESELVGMFKHYVITRLSEENKSLRERYVGNEELFGTILGFFFIYVFIHFLLYISIFIFIL